MKKIKISLKKNYIVLIKNSEGTKTFRDCFGRNKRTKNLTEGGVLSCVFYISSILYLFGLIPKIHLSVKCALKDMKKCRWYEIRRLKKGSVILWEKKKDHYHLGFYLGKKKAISNDSTKKEIRIHHFTFRGKRRIETIFWNKKLDNEKRTVKTIKEP